jgi:TetR/AcrR family tetracycline transcriptional repressor
VVRRQEVTFGSLVRQGFTLPNAARGLVLLHDFTIGFCVEEQAVSQAIEAGDGRYSPSRRAELIGRQAAPLAVEAGSVIFGDPNTRFTELVELLLDPWRGCARRDGRHDVGEKWDAGQIGEWR